MSENFLVFEDVEAINNEIKKAIEKSNELKIELLRHYLLNYILYLNDKESLEIKNELLRISILLEKLITMEKKLNFADGRRLLTTEMMKNKKKSNSKTSGKKFSDNYKKLKDKMESKDDSVKKAKSNKFN